MPKLLRILAAVVFAAASSSCRDQGVTDVLSTNEVQFSIVSGNEQSAPAGQELPAALVVRVADGRGNPVEGQIVNFVVTRGGGSVFAGAAITDRQGIARDWWTLGQQPGVNELEVRAVNSTTGEPRVFGRFRATGELVVQRQAPGMEAIGEYGQVRIGKAGDGWHTVRLSRSYTDPVVVMGPVSSEGGDPVTVRVRNVRSNAFQFILEKWGYLNQNHPAETVSYLVVEAGSHRLPDGARLQAGITSGVTHSWRKVSLSGFSSAPVVLAQLASTNEGTPAVTRQQNVAPDGFVVQLQESEASDDVHAGEEVHWIAMGQTVIPGVLEVRTPGSSMAHRWSTIRFDRALQRPAFLAALQTTNGSDPAALRQRRLAGSGVEVRVEEERSADRDTWHIEERVGYVALSRGGEIDSGATVLMGAR